MPIIEMHLMEGRTSQQKKQAAKAITAALTETMGVNAESVRILITEHSMADFYVAGLNIQERAALQKEVEKV